MGDWFRHSAQEGEIYDVIIALDVIEHPPPADLLPVLSACRGRLAPNGRLILRAPNPSCPLVLPMFYGDSTHQTTLSDRLLAHLLGDAGFAGAVLTEETRPHSRWKRTVFPAEHRKALAPALRALYPHSYGYAPSALTPNYHCFAYAQ